MKNITNGNIAIVHDALEQHGGSEEVVYALSDIFPQADIYTLWSNNNGQTTKRLRGHRIEQLIPSILQNLNKNIIKLLASLVWSRVNFSNYDIVISSSHSYSSKSIITPPTVHHICYCHTPPKYLYDEKSESEILLHHLFLKRMLLSILRANDYKAAQKPDMFIANSKTVQQRIKKYYHRDSIVIYPPVSVPSQLIQHKPKNYFISIGRLTKTKGVDLAIRACNKLKEKLVIIGDGGERSYLQEIAGPTVTFTGPIDNRTKINYLKYAKGFIFPSIDEDFGIAPVEAMGYGVPVIAFYSGASRETITEWKTGLFFRTYSTASLINSLRTFSHIKFSQKDCHAQAKRFTAQKFKKNILHVVDTLCKE